MRSSFRLLKHGLVAAALAATASIGIAPQARAADPALEITWLGGPSMMREFNGVTLLTDPMFGEGKEAFVMGDPNEMFDLAKGPTIKSHARLTPFPAHALKAADHILLSHAHEDHFDQAAQAELPKTQAMMVPAEDREKLAGLGFTNLTPMQWGDSLTLEAGAGTITVSAIPADHSPDAAMAPFLGHGNGYWIRFAQGDWEKTLYWTGDSFGTDKVLAALKGRGAPNILVPNMGAVGTTGPLGQISMGADEVLELAKQLGNPRILPIHHSSYALYLEPISALEKKIKDSGSALDLIGEGESRLYR